MALLIGSTASLPDAVPGLLPADAGDVWPAPPPVVASLEVSPSPIVASDQPIPLRLVGTGTFWTADTDFGAMSGGGGVELVALTIVSVDDFTHATVTVELDPTVLGGLLRITAGDPADPTYVWADVPVVAPSDVLVLNPTGVLMKSWLPEMWYGRSTITDALLDAEGRALDQAAADVTLVREARLPETAQEWGIARLESEAGLAPRPELSLEERRSRVIAHFRGIGSTIARLKTIANSWEFGEVDINPDPEGFTLYVTFVDERGVPEGLADHQAEFRANVQAHLDVQWLFRFTTHGEIRQAGRTHADIKATGLSHSQLKTWNPSLA